MFVSFSLSLSLFFPLSLGHSSPNGQYKNEFHQKPVSGFPTRRRFVHRYSLLQSSSRLEAAAHSLRSALTDKRDLVKVCQSLLTLRPLLTSLSLSLLFFLFFFPLLFPSLPISISSAVPSFCHSAVRIRERVRLVFQRVWTKRHDRGESRSARGDRVESSRVDSAGRSCTFGAENRVSTRFARSIFSDLVSRTRFGGARARSRGQDDDHHTG